MIYRAGIINDLHGPFEDPRALSLVLDVFHDIRDTLDEIILNGDVLDFYSVNMHGPKHPEVLHNLEREIEWGIDFFANLRKKFPKHKITFIYGNHEDRLDRWMVKHVPAFYNYLRLEQMLRLEDLNIEWLPYNSAYQLQKTRLYVQHSPPSYSENAAGTSLKKKPGASFLWGCTHRMQHFARTNYDGTVDHAWLNGWLGSTTLSKEHRRVFSYAKGHESWQQCFAIATVMDKEFDVQQYSITKNYKAVVDGNIYEG